MREPSLYGLVAEFSDPGKLLEATKQVRSEGYRSFETYSPYPIEQIDELIDEWNPLPLIVLAGGCLGAATAWGLQYYITVINYPINVGGRPLYSWPTYIVILFELTVLFASVSAFLGSLVLCGFPRPNFPLFNLPRFAAASSDSFFLCIEAEDVHFELDRTTRLLESLDPVEVWEVED